MQSYKLDLFEIPESEKMMGEIRSLEKSLENVRRGLFARHDELAKRYLELREEVDRLQTIINLQQHFEVPTSATL